MTTAASTLPRPLPRRDAEARARLREVAGLSRPIMLAREQALPVGVPLGDLIPGRALQRGTVITVQGAPGAGSTSLAFALAAAATTAGEWAGAVDLDGGLGAEAAAAAGVALERFPVVRHVPRDRWATVVATLLDGTTLVLAEVPPHVRVGDARRLVARARERRAVLVALPQPGARWPADATLRLVATGGAWRGLDRGAGFLDPRELTLRVEGRGAAACPKEGRLARAG